MGVTAGALLGLLAPFVVPVLFGDRWRPAVLCLELSLPIIVSGFIASPFGATLDVLERQDLHLLRDIIRGLIMSAALAADADLLDAAEQADIEALLQSLAQIA